MTKHNLNRLRAQSREWRRARLHGEAEPRVVESSESKPNFLWRIASLTRLAVDCVGVLGTFVTIYAIFNPTEASEILSDISSSLRANEEGLRSIEEGIGTSNIVLSEIDSNTEAIFGSSERIGDTLERSQSYVDQYAEIRAFPSLSWLSRSTARVDIGVSNMSPNVYSHVSIEIVVRYPVVQNGLLGHMERIAARRGFLLLPDTTFQENFPMGAGDILFAVCISGSRDNGETIYHSAYLVSDLPIEESGNVPVANYYEPSVESPVICPDD